MWVQPWDGWAAAACPLDGGSGRESLAAQTAGPRSHVAGDGESRPVAHPRALILKETRGEEHTHTPDLSLGESGVIFTILTEAEQISSRKTTKTLWPELVHFTCRSKNACCRDRKLPGPWGGQTC